MPAAIENEPNVVNRDMNAAPCSSAVLRASCLLLSASSPSCESVGRRLAITRSVAPAPPRLATKTSLTRPGLPSSRCASGERHEQALVGRAPTAVAHDVPDAHDLHRAPDEDAQSVAAASAEARGGFRVQVDLVRRELRERHRAASTAHRAECPQRPRLAGEERDTRLVLSRGQVLHRDGLDDHGGHAVDETGGRGRACDAGGVALREVAHAGRTGAVGREGGLDAACGNHLVGVAERGDCGRADRLAHRVARRKGGGDDRRAQHRSGDDQGGAPRPPAHVADAEPEEDAVACREHGDGAQRDREGGEEHDQDRLDRDAEERAHGQTPERAASGASAIPTA